MSGGGVSCTTTACTAFYTPHNTITNFSSTTQNQNNTFNTFDINASFLRARLLQLNTNNAKQQIVQVDCDPSCLTVWSCTFVCKSKLVLYSKAFARYQFNTLQTFHIELGTWIKILDSFGTNVISCTLQDTQLKITRVSDIATVTCLLNLFVTPEILQSNNILLDNFESECTAIVKLPIQVVQQVCDTFSCISDVFTLHLRANQVVLRADGLLHSAEITIHCNCVQQQTNMYSIFHFKQVYERLKTCKYIKIIILPSLSPAPQSSVWLFASETDVNGFSLHYIAPRTVE